MITYPGKLYQILEFWMSQYFSRYGIFSWVLDDTLWFTIIVILDRNDSRWETISEFLLMFARDG
jgi:hypothetical protein